MMERTNRSACAFKFGLRAGKLDGVHAAECQGLPERCRIQRIAVNNEMAGLTEEAVDLVEQSPCHVAHPAVVGLVGDARDFNPAGLQVDEEQDVVAEPGRAV